MANSFSKEERVAFEQLLEGFQDALIMSKNVSIYKTDMVTMERTNNVLWRPQPYIAQSFNGTDMTNNFKPYTQLTVPATLGYRSSVPWSMTNLELRDALQEQRLTTAAKEKIASDINVAVLNVISKQSTLTVCRTGAATGFDDIAQVDALMNEQGVPWEDRYLALNSRDYNNMASNLQALSRSFGNKKSENAYERAYLGTVLNMETYKLDYANSLTGRSSTTTTVDTRATASNYYVPKATSTATTGEVGNVDNRYQTITVTSTSSLLVGDAITISGVTAAHHITKRDTGKLKTFRVLAIPTSTTVTISPPIISNQGGSDAEIIYQNVIVVAASSGTLTVINTDTTGVNCFWYKDAVELLPGRFVVPSDAGVAVMRATTDQGIELVMQKFQDINTNTLKYRIDTLYGVCHKQPEMTGILLFGQDNAVPA